MSELIDKTVVLVEGFNEEIRSDLSSKGIDSSNTASNSIHIIVSGNKITSLGIDYLTYLNTGRGPGKFPPPENIIAWAARKPVPISPYVIGRKIAREGTEIYKNPSKGIMLGEKRQRLLSEIKQNAPIWAKNDTLNIITSLNKAIK